MRENRTYGSEGGDRLIICSLPLSNTICKKSQPPRAESDPKDNFKMNQPRSLDNEGGLLLISNDTSILFFKTVTHR